MANEWTKYVFCVQLYFNIIKWVHCPMRLLLGKCHSRSSLVCVGVKLSWYIYYCEWWWWDVLSIFCSTGNHGNYFSVSVIWTYFRHNETGSIVLAALYVRIWKLEYPLLLFSGWCQINDNCSVLCAFKLIYFIRSYHSLSLNLQSWILSYLFEELRADSLISSSLIRMDFCVLLYRHCLFQPGPVKTDCTK